MRQSKLRSGLSSEIIIDTAVAAKCIRDLNEKGLESANVAGWNETIAGFSFPPLFILSFPLRIFPPRDILIPIGYFCGKLTAFAVYSTSNGFRRFTAILDTHASAYGYCRYARLTWISMNLDFYVHGYREKGERGRESYFIARPVRHLFAGTLWKLFVFIKERPIMLEIPLQKYREMCFFLNIYK